MISYPLSSGARACRLVPSLRFTTLVAALARGVGLGAGGPASRPSGLLPVDGFEPSTKLPSRAAYAAHFPTWS